MPDWLREGLARTTVIPTPEVVVRLLAALLFGYLIAGIYLRSRRHESDIGASFPMTLVLLSVLVAMVTQVIGNNVARAFSLVGTLAIVRFRTVVRDTRDTIYVIFAVVVGMAIGAAYLWIALIGLVIIAVAALLLPLRARPLPAPERYELRLRVALGRNPDNVASELLDQHLVSRSLLAMSTSRPGVALDYSYEVELKPGASAQALVQALSLIEGLQEVRIARRVPESVMR
ncbi:MAG TPA: DUF4956 domain-containing protein [Steroidobacteraceae bacterium]|nr:DUF4956 domain-containing protein [Steroidobacteraceae bacterium]